MHSTGGRGTVYGTQAGFSLIWVPVQRAEVPILALGIVKFRRFRELGEMVCLGVGGMVVYRVEGDRGGGAQRSGSYDTYERQKAGLGEIWGGEATMTLAIVLALMLISGGLGWDLRDASAEKRLRQIRGGLSDLQIAIAEELGTHLATGELLTRLDTVVCMLKAGRRGLR